MSPEGDVPQIPGVELLGEVGRGAQSVVYRARRGGMQYAVKVQRRQAQKSEGAQSFWREAGALARAVHPALAPIREIGQVADFTYIIMDFLEGPTLAERLQAGPLGANELRHVAVAVAGALGEVHRYGLIHRDIKPQNILCPPGSQPTLIDFGLAETINAEVQSGTVVGTLLYCSPEQGGMLKVPVDGRSDLYSLGVTLFEAATGRTPFQSTNPIELLHLHATAAPPEPRSLNPDVPPALAAIIRKLLAKDPDDRYQSTAGLVEDLGRVEELEQRLLEGQPLALDIITHAGASFHDLPLVGRDAELNQLKQLWRATLAGEGAIALVAGEPGSGKSRLSRELMQRARAQDSLLLAARCPPGNVVPFAPLRNALDEWLRSLARLPEPQRLAAEERVRAAAGDAAPLLRPFSPRLAAILKGGSGVVAGADLQDTFYDALVELLVALGRSFGSALVLLDDVHWIDDASLQVVRRLCARLPHTPMLVLATGRSDPANAAGTQRFADAVSACGRRLELLPLAREGVARLVRAHLAHALIDPLVIDKVALRSGGNPFAVGEYLRAMLDEGLLRPHWGAWKFDASRLEQLELPADVLELVVRRIADLAPSARKMLAAAAVLGGSIRSALLAEVCEASAEQVRGALGEATTARLIEHVEGGEYMFVHDRVREGLLTDVAPPEKQRLHRRIADVLRGHTLGGDEVYALAQHSYLGGLELEAAQVFAANDTAARKAAEAYAFEQAYTFFSQAAEAALAASLSLEPRFEAAFGATCARIAKVSEALLHLQRALESSTDPLQRASLQLELSRLYMSKHDTAACNRALDGALAELGQRRPTKSLVSLLGSLFRAVQGAVYQRRARSTTESPLEERERYRILVAVYLQLSVISYFELDALNMFQALLRAYPGAALLGPSRELVEWRATAATILAMLRRDKAAHALMSGALANAQQLGDPLALARARFGAGVAEHFLGHCEQAEQLTRATLQEQGAWLSNFDYLSAATDLAWNLMMRGHVQEGLERIETALARVARSSGNVSSLEGHTCRCYAGPLLAMLGRPSEGVAQLDQFQRILESSASSRWRSASYLAHRALFYVEQGDLGAQFDVTCGRFDALGLNPGRVPLTLRQYYVARAMAALARFEAAPPAERQRARSEVERALGELQRTASHPTLRCHEALLQAVFARLDGRLEELEERLGTAEGLALEHDNRWVLFGVTRERARVLSQRGQRRTAQYLAEQAWRMAVDHGWVSRARSVRNEFKLERSGTSNAVTDKLTGVSSEHRTLHLNRYLESLVEVSNASAATLDPEQQARGVLDVLVRILGAERAFLFLLEGDDHSPVLRAARDAQGNDLRELTGFSLTVVKQVRATEKPVVVSGTEQGGEIRAAASVVAQDLRSIMAAPVELRDEMVGIVYLDSRLARGVFTEDDLVILRAIANHIAFALETRRAGQLEARVEAERAQRTLSETLRAVSVTLNASLNLEAVLDGALQGLTRVVPHDRALVLLRQDRGFHVVAGRGHVEGAEPRTFEVKPSSPLSVLVEKRSAISGKLAAGDTHPLDADDAREWIAVPLVVRDETVGVLVLESLAARQYTERETELVVTFAEQAATAVENARLFQEVQRRSVSDALTGAFNRRQLFILGEQELRRAERSARPLSAVMVDVDHFKRVNDTYGHTVGDQVLCAVVERMRDTIRATDVLARYGGEEFAVVMGETDASQARDVAERLRQAVAEAPVVTTAGEVKVTISLGVATCAAPSLVELSVLLSRADAALYKAKSSGRDRVMLEETPVIGSDHAAGDRGAH